MISRHASFRQARTRTAQRVLFAAACVALSLAWAIGGPAARAATAPERSVSSRADVRLIADVDVAAPGTQVRLALHQILAPGWHTYWRNPGDSGLATAIAWTAPNGLKVSEIEWPAPRRYPLPPLMNYSYAEEAILVMRLHVPEDWPIGLSIELAANADWLVCEKLCIPERQNFTLSLPVGASPSLDQQAASIIARGEASQPTPFDGPATAAIDSDRIRLTLEAPEFAVGELNDVYFFTEDPGVVEHAGEQQALRSPLGLEVTLPRGRAAPGGSLRGVLTAVDASGGAPTPIAIAIAAPVRPVSSTVAELGLGLAASLPAAALLAFLGGLILNLMPCVFPILALKALSLSSGADHFAGRRLGHALAYGGGVMLTFLALAATLIAIKSAGVLVGWGYQLQTPAVVAALAYLMFLIGLNLSGVVELPSGLSRLGAGWTATGGAGGSFMTGVLAVIVASPCTAPFMGAALGYAMTQDPLTALTVFAALALGFSAPLIALSVSPAFAKALPRPGPWMSRFRQALSFPMYLTAAWLLWVLGNQNGNDAVFAALVGLVLLALAAWTMGVGRPNSRAGRRVAAIAAALALVGALAALTPSLSANFLAPMPVGTEPRLGEPFDPARLAQLHGEGRQVFLNFTADWCITCKFNERVALSGPEFEELLASTETVYMVADWTRRDPIITEALASYGRVGVPLYVVYPADGGRPQLLPQLLSARIVRGALAGGA